jgi:argininosuccinate lyase
MPQKRNPDAAELSRAKVGRIAGAFQSLVVVMKGLPLAYSKDMQEDKEVAFDAFDSTSLALAAMAGMVEDLEPVPAVLADAAGRGFSTATDLADYLVRELQMPFRDAHHVTGRVVKLAETAGLTLEAVPLVDLQTVEPRLTQAVFSVLSVDSSVRSRTSYGGTAPQNVAKMAALWIERLETPAKAG